MNSKNNSTSDSSSKIRNEGLSDRRRRYRSGWQAELVGAAFFMLRGYRVLARRARTPYGEIDLIVFRRGRISFVEVKARRTLEAAQSSITARQGARVKRAATAWLQNRPRFQNCEMTFDLLFVLPWRLPEHIVNGL